MIKYEAEVIFSITVVLRSMNKKKIKKLQLADEAV
jgi:hypothetical protein